MEVSVRRGSTVQVKRVQSSNVNQLALCYSHHAKLFVVSDRCKGRD